jgi:small subunit ribosomal protein S8
MVNDLVADAITRIRNASTRKLEVTTVLYSKLVVNVLKILVDKGYIESYKVIDKAGKQKINVALKYDENENSPINEIKKISKPGRRVFKGKDEIKRFKNGYGTIIVSTSRGVLSNEEASAQGVGGELLVSVW